MDGDKLFIVRCAYDTIVKISLSPFWYRERQAIFLILVAMAKEDSTMNKIEKPKEKHFNLRATLQQLLRDTFGKKRVK